MPIAIYLCSLSLSLSRGGARCNVLPLSFCGIDCVDHDWVVKYLRRLSSKAWRLSYRQQRATWQSMASSPSLIDTGLVHLES